MRLSALSMPALLLGLTVGCGVLNHQQAANMTQVELGGNNYTVVQTNVEGQDSGWGLFFDFAGLPITRPTVNDAMHEVMSKVNANGRPVALVNVTRAVVVSNWLLFHVVQERVRADVVEFNK